MPKSKSRWQKFRKSFSKAFFIREEDEPFLPTERQKEIVSKLAGWVSSRQLNVPAMMMLESITPLNFLGSQVLVFFYPFVTAFLNADSYKEFQQMLEHRQSIQYMIDVLDDLENQRARKKKAGNIGSEQPADKE